METGRSLNAVSRYYTSLDELLADSRELTLDLLAGPVRQNETQTAKGASAETTLPKEDGTSTEPESVETTPIRSTIPLVANMRIDGNNEDWNSVKPLFIDDEFGGGSYDLGTRKIPATDIYKVHLAKDNTHLYQHIAFSVEPPEIPYRIVCQIIIESSPENFFLIESTRAANTNRWTTNIVKYDTRTDSSLDVASGMLRRTGAGFEARYLLRKIQKEIPSDRWLQTQVKVYHITSNEMRWNLVDSFPLIHLKF